MISRICMALALLALANLGGCTAAPRPTETIRTSADHYFKIGDYEAARDEYAEIVSRYPGDWDGQYKLGMCCLQTQEFSTARRALEIAHTRQPNNQDVANALAESMYRQGDESRLFAFLRQRAAETQTAEAHRQLGRYAMELNDPDSARVAFQTAIEVDNGQTTEPYIDTAALSERLGQLDDAIRRLRQAYGINPRDRRVTEKLHALGEDPTTITPLPPGW
jgi:tetratricopeptide (TPR) repeat protein